MKHDYLAEINLFAEFKVLLIRSCQLETNPNKAKQKFSDKIEKDNLLSHVLIRFLLKKHQSSSKLMGYSQVQRHPIQAVNLDHHVSNAILLLVSHSRESFDMETQGQGKYEFFFRSPLRKQFGILHRFSSEFEPVVRRQRLARGLFTPLSASRDDEIPRAQDSCKLHDRKCYKVLTARMPFLSTDECCTNDLINALGFSVERRSISTTITVFSFEVLR